jgi:hypothetical protein
MTVISIVCYFFDGSFYKAASIAGTCFFGICTLYVLRLYRKPKQMFELSEEGFRDYTMFPNLGIIPWNQIMDVTVETRNERRYLCLKCRDLEDDIRALPASQEKRIYENLKQELEPVSVVADTAEQKPEELKNLILNYKNKNLERK